MRKRSKAREIALCVLYEIEVSKKSFNEVLNHYYDSFPSKIGTKPFATQILKGVTENIKDLDTIIKKYVKNWEIGRMAIIDRNVLRLATYELLKANDIPPKVSINEAVELAKRFGDVDSPRFVNGILDKIFKLESQKNSSKNA